MNPLTALPRVPLAALPTPLQHAPRLSKKIGLEVWLKRDDLTGVGLGGNKIRALEYLVGEALSLGSDCLVTGAGPRSNWAMLAAVVARRCELDPYLVYYGSPSEPAGNHLLAGVIDTDIRFTGTSERSSVDKVIAELTEELRAAGRTPYPLPRGGATALGAIGYVQATFELAAQFAENDLAPTELWLACGSCGTQAGLLAGARLMDAQYGVTGVTVSRPAAESLVRVSTLAGQAAELLALPALQPDDADVTIVDGYIGPGYGVPSPAGEQAARLVAQTEGIFLDPIFGAKAMAALVDAGRRGTVTGPVVFLVTGGAATLFGSERSKA